MAYWGCGTKRNKVAWTVIAAMFLIGFGLVIAGAAGNYSKGSGEQDCLEVFTDCMTDGYCGDNGVLHRAPYASYASASGSSKWCSLPDGKDPFGLVEWEPSQGGRKACLEQADAECGLRTWVSLILAGLALLVLALPTSCYFCCCAPHPALAVDVFDAPVGTAQPLAPPAKGTPVPSWQLQVPARVAMFYPAPHGAMTYPVDVPTTRPHCCYGPGAA